MTEEVRARGIDARKIQWRYNRTVPIKEVSRRSDGDVSTHVTLLLVRMESNCVHCWPEYSVNV